eukprot:jgi/Ulvmu1/5513/UM023_0049.1
MCINKWGDELEPGVPRNASLTCKTGDPATSAVLPGQADYIDGATSQMYPPPQAAVPSHMQPAGLAAPLPLPTARSAAGQQHLQDPNPQPLPPPALSLEPLPAAQRSTATARRTRSQTLSYGSRSSIAATPAAGMAAAPQPEPAPQPPAALPAAAQPFEAIDLRTTLSTPRPAQAAGTGMISHMKPVAAPRRQMSMNVPVPTATLLPTALPPVPESPAVVAAPAPPEPADVPPPPSPSPSPPPSSHQPQLFSQPPPQSLPLPTDLMDTTPTQQHHVELSAQQHHAELWAPQHHAQLSPLAAHDVDAYTLDAPQPVPSSHGTPLHHPQYSPTPNPPQVHRGSMQEGPSQHAQQQHTPDQPQPPPPQLLHPSRDPPMLPASQMPVAAYYAAEMLPVEDYGSIQHGGAGPHLLPAGMPPPSGVMEDMEDFATNFGPPPGVYSFSVREPMQSSQPLDYPSTPSTYLPLPFTPHDGRIWVDAAHSAGWVNNASGIRMVPMHSHPHPVQPGWYMPYPPPGYMIAPRAAAPQIMYSMHSTPQVRPRCEPPVGDFLPDDAPPAQVRRLSTDIDSRMLAAHLQPPPAAARFEQQPVFAPAAQDSAGSYNAPLWDDAFVHLPSVVEDEGPFADPSAEGQDPLLAILLESDTEADDLQLTPRFPVSPLASPRHSTAPPSAGTPRGDAGTTSPFVASAPFQRHGTAHLTGELHGTAQRAADHIVTAQPAETQHSAAHGGAAQHAVAQRSMPQHAVARHQAAQLQDGQVRVQYASAWVISLPGDPHTTDSAFDIAHQQRRAAFPDADFAQGVLPGRVLPAGSQGVMGGLEEIWHQCSRGPESMSMPHEEHLQPQHAAVSHGLAMPMHVSPHAASGHHAVAPVAASAGMHAAQLGVHGPSHVSGAHDADGSELDLDDDMQKSLVDFADMLSGPGSLSGSGNLDGQNLP